MSLTKKGLFNSVDEPIDELVNSIDEPNKPNKPNLFRFGTGWVQLGDLKEVKIMVCKLKCGGKKKK